MSRTITIDPLTRIEGHLKITVEVDGGVVTDAHTVAPMYRGFEKLLEGKDPRDASFITSRICGVCFSVHTMASARTLDDAFGAQVPAGGRLIRNLIMGAQFVYDHLLHFYHLTALDYIDIAKAATYSGSDAALKQVAAKVAALVKAGDTHPLAPSYKPDPYCVDDPDGAVALVAHYLDALKMQMLAKRMGAIFGGRAPHYQSIVVGGVTKLPDKAEVAQFRALLKQVKTFVNDVYVEDAVALATGKLWPLATTDFGVGHPNFLAYGSFDQTDTGAPLLEGGVITKLDPKGIVVDPLSQSKITESVKHSWYKQTGPLHPSVGETDVDPDAAGGYSFCKAPRYDGEPYEVGPLARMLILKEKHLLDLLAKGARPGAVARHVARAHETALVCDAMAQWLDELEVEMGKPGFKIHDTAHWDPPAAAQGKGFYDAPRGALGHWISIKDSKIERYQAVVPSTWNASPRDDSDVRGPYEEALIGCPVPDEDNPINVARIIRSFDPCLGCAVHLVDPGERELKRFVIDPTLGRWG